MASSMGIKTAVSDYEFLNRKIPLRGIMGKNPNYIKDEEFPRLKPKRHINKSVSSHDILNINNSNVSEPEKARCDGIERSKLYDDVGHSLNSIPVPFPWSPSMAVTSNPALFITPQKSFSKDSSLPVKDNILEPESANKIPKPMAWSPGMEIQPDPNLFITPEKCMGKKILTDIIGDQYEKTAINGIMSKQSVSTKTKEAYSVRFDLPSSTSGDETTDSVSETNSPITLRGCEISTEKHNLESPVWKAFSPQMTYNPNAYSDESSLDESAINSLPTVKRDPSYNYLKTSLGSCTSDNSSIEASYVISKFPETSSKMSSSHYEILNLSDESDHNLAAAHKDLKCLTSSLKEHKLKQPKSNTLVTAKLKSQNNMKRLGKSSAKGEPHIISPSPSHCQLLSPESTVIREMKDNLLSTEYSFPFDLRATTEDLEYEHVFTRPEFNSTLKVRAELNTLLEQEVDVAATVEVSLAKSEVKRLELNEKAAAYTNRMSNQFKNLIDLNTSVETLCDRVVRMRTSKIASKKKGTHVDKKITGLDRAPDLLEFFTSDLQKESPDLTLPGVAHLTSKLITAPHNIAFDLYRHNRIWEGINDF